MKSITISQRYS